MKDLSKIVNEEEFFGSHDFNGVNWADARDNFVDGWIIPSGIDHRADRSEVAAQAQNLLVQFKKLLNANTVRLGVNPATVNNKDWWPKYRAAIQEALDLGYRVILACWESASSKDGRIDDPEQFDDMWVRLLCEFAENAEVHFEIFNEPFGYSGKEWRDIASAWIVRHGGKIKGNDCSRILVSGTGYNECLKEVATDKRLDGCRLSFHLYAWFGGKHETIAGWTREIQTRIGKDNAHRTIVTEWGAPMNGLPHDHYSEDSPHGDSNRAYLVAMSEVIANWRMGSVYWPGLRDGDDFSLTQRTQETGTIRITNESGKARVLRSYQKLED